MPKRVRVYSWNVNGLRAAAKKGFCEWLDESGGHFVAVQEVRASLDQIPPELAERRRWHAHFAFARRAGYSGVGLFSRARPERVDTSIGVKTIDREGRLIIGRFGSLIIVNAYFPNGNGTILPNGRRSNDRVPFKLRFYRRLFGLLEPERAAGARILVMGDFNTAHTEIDLARPRSNLKNSGFLPEERAELDRWIRLGWIDTFRRFEPGPGHYTWWSQRFGVREKDIGWRLDYILASPAAAEFLDDAQIHKSVTGSDHCPVSVDLDRRVLAG